ncbi:MULTISPECIES: hypothetical protein [Flavobacteriaceae]|uniref:hypothetical protein n=1 Tax=Flavobacteriaceae TaxID=49546 RepID=UPI00234983B7|nr:hypothetical protein [Muricauda sp. SP22]MDC6361230.1 hypothetical protein [Muricauda sp. SP22]
MKTHIIYWAIGLLMINTLSGQVKIGDNPQSIHPASILELESNTGALVISRVTTAEMNNIVPLDGAMVYNIEEDCLHYYNGTEWVNLCEDNRITFSTLALFNPTSRDSTVVITSEDTPDGINYNFEVNKITSENIANNTVLREDLSFGIIGQQQLQDGAVTNPKLDKANIPLSGFGIPTADVSMGNAARITNLVNPTAPQDAATMSYVDARADDDITGVIFTPATNQLTVNEGTTTFSADLSALEESADIATNTANITANTTAINDHIADDLDLDITNEIQNIEEVLADGNNANGAVITGLGTPTVATDAATKAYVDTEITNNAADGSETIVNAGTDINITGNGTAATPYVINSTFAETQDLADVIANDPSAGNSRITNVLDPTDPQDAATMAYVDTEITNNAADGSETIVNAGTDINITGNGTAATPYVINSTFAETQDLADVIANDPSAGNSRITNVLDPTDPQDAATMAYVDTEITNNAADGTETSVNGAGINVVTGDGSTGNPYVVTGTEAQDLADVIAIDPSAGNSRITNVLDPTDPQDAATMSYVDTFAEEIALSAQVPTGTGVAGAYTIFNAAIAANSIIQLTVEQNTVGNPVMIQLTNQVAGSFSVQIYEFIAPGFVPTAANANWQYIVVNP